MSSSNEQASSVDWAAIARAESRVLVEELQRQLDLPPARKNEAMRCGVGAPACTRAGAHFACRFLEVHRGLLLAAKAHIEDTEREGRRSDAQEWREATRLAARERSSRSQHAARASAAAAVQGADAAAPRGGTWERALALAQSLPRPATGPRKSSVSRAFASTMLKAHEAEKGHGGAPA